MSNAKSNSAKCEIIKEHSLAHLILCMVSGECITQLHHCILRLDIFKPLRNAFVLPCHSNLKMSQWSMECITLLFQHTVSRSVMIITFCMCRGHAAFGLSLYLQIKGFIITTVSRSVMLVVIYLWAMIDSLAWTLCCFSLVSVKSRL